MNFFCLDVNNKERNETAMTYCVKSSDGPIYLVAEELNKNTLYIFTIISNNSIEQQSTTAVQFCKHNNFENC